MYVKINTKNNVRDIYVNLTSARIVSVPEQPPPPSSIKQARLESEKIGLKGAGFRPPCCLLFRP